MTRRPERSPQVIGAVGIAVVTAAVVGALEYDKLPLINSTEHYSAYFADAAGLTAGTPVQVAGYDVGKVSSLRLDGPRVRVDFTVDSDIVLGDLTEAAIKTKTLLGARTLLISSRGSGHLSSSIPLERTKVPYELPQALSDISASISDLNTASLNESLTTVAQTFSDTPADLKDAVHGVARFSEAISRRDTQLRALLADANAATRVLSDRTTEIVKLVHDTNSLLAQLRTQSAALHDISANIAALAQQISGVIADNKNRLRPALDKLNGALEIIDSHKEKLQKSISLLSSFVLSLGEAVSGGPFFKSYMTNLAPGQFLQPFIDAAFSDLGLDPHVLLPSQLTDPQIGQKATPPAPTPFPRTGQGGEPRLTVPDAITGNPGDPRYPYREPDPAPAPGGLPPGPPAGYNPAAPPEPARSTPTSTEVTTTPPPQGPLPPELTR